MDPKPLVPIPIRRYHWINRMRSVNASPRTRPLRLAGHLVCVGVLIAALTTAVGCDDSGGENTMPGDTSTAGDGGGDTTVTTGGDTTSTTGGDTTSTTGGDTTSTMGDASGDMGGDTSMCASDRVCGSVCCADDQFCINGGCRDSCGSGVTCGPTGGLCCLSSETCLPDDTCGLGCEVGETPCGTGVSATCCAVGEVCDSPTGSCQMGCDADETLCGNTCCGADQMCLADDQCVAMCANVEKLCGETDELCCGDTEVCLGGTTCVEPGSSCTLTEQCAIDEYCEPTLGACVPRDAINVCEFRPPVGAFAPAPGCTWRAEADNTAPALANSPGGACSTQSRVCTNADTSACLAGEVCRNVGGGNLRCDCADNSQACFGGTCRSPNYGEMSDVVMTPTVVNLTDDNGDGATDTADTPDIVFTSFSYYANGCCTSNGVLRIAPGNCNADGTLDTTYTFSDIWIDNSGGIAIGNLHPATATDETVPEIVATSRNNGAFALRRTAADGTAWEVLWHNMSITMPSGATPAIADLNGDGQPEVVIGNVVLNGLDGSVLMDGATLTDPATGNTGTGGVGYNSFLGPSSAVADIDLDGIQEVIAGNSVYEWNGTDARIECTYTFTTSNSSCQGGNGCDGFNAIGDFDNDQEGELVLVREGQVFVLNHDCSEVDIVDVPVDDGDPPLGDGACTRNESGPPTVADFDGDGEPEIGTAGADFYTVVDFQCVGDPLPAECFAEKILWVAPNNDCSSRSTASSVFDFEGDGAAEVVYADEQNFFVLSGTDGSQLFVDPAHSSNTRIEMPVVVDVDNDGKSEVIVAKATSSDADEGLTIWQDADNNWVRTRRIWNQHGYHVTNVTETGQIPPQEEINWLNSRLNNYRQNVQPGGLFDAPDLTVDSFATDTSQCATRTVGLSVTVRNDGALGVPAGILVHIVVTYEGTQYDLGAFPTTEPMLPGQSTTIQVPWTQPQGASAELTITATVDDDGMGNAQYNECEEGNNSQASVPLDACAPA